MPAHTNLYPKGRLDLAKIRDALYTWIRKETEGVIDDGHIIWRDGSRPLPARPCVTLKLIAGPRPTGFSDNLSYVSGGTYNLGGQREMDLSIQVFGNTQIHRPMAYQLTTDLHSSLAKLTVLDFLRGAGISVQRRGDPINITALEETEYEERAQFDVLMGVAQNVLDDPGIIEQAVITANVDSP